MFNDGMTQIKKIGVGIAVAILALIAWGSWFSVDSGERAVVLRFGKCVAVADAGLNFKWPLISDVKRVSVRTLVAHDAAQAGSNNMQNVKTTVSVNYHFIPTKLPEIYARTGFDDIEALVIKPRIQEVVKSVVARYTAENLILKREDVKSEIKETLSKMLLAYDLNTEDIQITDFKFSDDFTAAIEEKQTAEQKALTAKNNLARIKIESDQVIAASKGKAEAIRIEIDAIKSQGGVEYIQLKAIEKWNGQLPTYSGSGPLPFLNIK